MADYGAMFDKAKVNADTKAQGYHDAALKAHETQELVFQKEMEPLEKFVRPELEKCREALKSRGVSVQIDFDPEYNQEVGKRLPSLHFQMSYEGFQSKVYIFEIRDRQFSCSSDDGKKAPYGQRGGVFGSGINQIEPRLIKTVIERAINDIMQAKEQQDFRAAYPNTRTIAP